MRIRVSHLKDRKQRRERFAVLTAYDATMARLLERAGVDVDFDGHVDRWDHDTEARLAAEAKERGSEQGAKTGDGFGGDAGLAPSPATGDFSKLNTAGDGGAALSASKRKKK